MIARVAGRRQSAQRPLQPTFCAGGMVCPIATSCSYGTVCVSRNRPVMSPFEAAISVSAADLAQRFRRYLPARDVEVVVWVAQGSKGAWGSRERGDAEVSRDSLQNVASGALKGHQECLFSLGGGKVDSQAFQVMSVSEGLLRAVWRARREIRTIPRGWNRRSATAASGLCSLARQKTRRLVLGAEDDRGRCRR